jgi:cyclic pyranopterin phosphate synthase
MGGAPIDEEAMEAMERVEMDRRLALPGTTGVGYSDRESELLEVIGMAVKRKRSTPVWANWRT